MLTDKQIKGAAARDKPYRLTDGHGLSLQIMPASKAEGGKISKLWRYRYEFSGKEKMLALGKYPDVSLAQARKGREEARALLDKGRDPSAERILRKASAATVAAETFEVVAREWFALRSPEWVPRHRHNVLASLEADVFPVLGPVPIRDITPPMVLAVVRTVEKRGAIPAARKVRQRMSAVFVHAIATGRAEQDPAAVVAGAMAAHKGSHRPAVSSIEQARQVLSAVERQNASAFTLLAHRLIALTGVRANEAAQAEWREFTDLDGEAPRWLISKERMKMGREHAVLLSPQAVEVLQAARRYSGHTRFVFPNARRQYSAGISINATADLLWRAGYKDKHVPHGWRATLSTVLNERFPQDRIVIDMMLAHEGKGAVEAAYNRATHDTRKRELWTAWANMLLEGAVPVGRLVTQDDLPQAA